MGKKIEKKKLINRYFSGIFYPEDKEYKKYMRNILENFQEIAYIDHDRDIDEEGEKKKTHTHIIFKVGENARHRKAIAKIIECPENMIEGCNKDYMILYLIHANNPEKTQYNPSEVHGTLKEYLNSLLLKRQEPKQKLKSILEYIEENKETKMTNIVKLALELNYIDVLKNYQYIIKQLLDEQLTKQLKEEKERKKSMFISPMGVLQNPKAKPRVL